MMNKALTEYFRRKENEEALEHRDVLLAIASILKTKEGLTFFKYLFKNFDVACLPGKELDGNILHEYLGFLRAGNSIYKLASEADFKVSAEILAELERKRYDDKLEQYRIEQSNDGNDDDNYYD